MREDEKIILQYVELRNLLEIEQKKLGNRNEDLQREINRLVAQISYMEEKMGTLTNKTQKMIRSEAEEILNELIEETGERSRVLCDNIEKKIELVLNRKMKDLNKTAYEAGEHIDRLEKSWTWNNYFIAGLFLFGCLITSIGIHTFLPKKEYSVYAVTPKDIEGIYKKNIYSSVKDKLSPTAKKEFDQKLKELVWGKKKK